MEFNINLNRFLRKEISKINYTLLPEEFHGDRHLNSHCVAIMAEIIDRMGHASARAQDLVKPITSAEKLRVSQHIVYLLCDLGANNGMGTVIGMLKMGRKNLYVFDTNGICHETVALCVLDFYVHESMQRMGCGKRLFDYMLEIERVHPPKLAIDRPSEKFLQFLKKHYSLENIVPQTNNFVVYDGFFETNSQELSGCLNSSKRMSTYNRLSWHSSDHTVSYNGRHAAHKPQATIGQIIHSSAVL